MIAERGLGLGVAVTLLAACGQSDPDAWFDSDFCQQERWKVNQKVAEVNDILAAIQASTMDSAQTQEAFDRGDKLLREANEAIVAMPTCFVPDDVTAATEYLAEHN